jgi:hypothetical protein
MAVSGLFVICAQPVSAGESVADLNAASCVGQVCRVEGMVAGVSVKKNNQIVLAFGRPYPNQTFTAVIDDDSGMQLRDVQNLAGQLARVTGLVKMHKGRPEAVLTHPSQLASAQQYTP